MHRRLVSTIPLFVAAAVFVLTPPVFGAPQEHNHSASAGTDHACACCGNSGAGAMNHAAAEAPPAAQMDHGAKGCCDSMAMEKGEAAAKAADDASVKSDTQAFPIENGSGSERDDEAPPLE